MNEVLHRAKMKSDGEVHFDIRISHLSPCRVTQSILDTDKLQVVVSFAKLRKYLEQELENVVVKKQAGKF